MQSLKLANPLFIAFSLQFTLVFDLTWFYQVLCQPLTVTQTKAFQHLKDAFQGKRFIHNDMSFYGFWAQKYK